MKTSTFHDTAAFLEALAPLAEAREHAFNPLVGNALDDLQARRPPVAAVLLEAEGEPAGAALLTRLRPLRLTPLPEPATPLLVAELLRMRASPTIVAGEEATAAAFVELWCAATGAVARRYFQQILYVLREPPQAPAVPGSSRPMRAGDRELCAAWTVAFTAEALAGQPASEANTLEAALASLGRRSLDVWENNGRVVAMAALSGRTPRGCRITSVYTPPEERGRGYASALVAALTARALSEGRRYCAIYTDLTNATTNRIYPALGYQRVQVEASFELIAAAAPPPATD